MQLTEEKIQRIIDSYSIGQLTSHEFLENKLIDDISFTISLIKTSHGSFYLVGVKSSDLIKKRITTEDATIAQEVTLSSGIDNIEVIRTQPENLPLTHKFDHYFFLLKKEAQ